jgi:hypothetical protein
MLPNLSSLELVPTAAPDREPAALAARVAALPARCAREAAVRDWMAARVAAIGPPAKRPRANNEPEEPTPPKKQTRMCPLPFDLHELMVKQLDEPIDRLRVVQVLGYDKMEKTTSERQLFDAIQKAAEAAELLGFYEYDTKDSTGFRARQRVSDIETYYWDFRIKDFDAFLLLVTNGHFAKLKKLRTLVVTPASAKLLFDAIASTSLANFTSIEMSYNNIGDEGMKAFSSAIASGSLANLQQLVLSAVRIGHDEMAAFSAAIASGSLAKLEQLHLGYTRIGDKGMKAFSNAIASGSLANLKELDLGGNQIGDGGMKAFSTAIASGSLANLKVLDLSPNQIGDAGMAAFADAVASGSLPKLGNLFIDAPSENLEAYCSSKNINLN